MSTPSKTVTAYFIRHGQTYLNLYGKMQGWADAPLTESGIEDAHATGQRLASTRFDAIYASDLGRTIKTAEIIRSESACSKDVPIVAKAAFRESSFGALDGSFNDYVYGLVAERAGVARERVFQDLPLDELSNLIKEVDPAHAAETNDELASRVLSGVETMIDEVADGANVMVVTHGNVIRVLVSRIDPSVNVAVELKNSGVTTIRFDDKKAGILGFNE